MKMKKHMLGACATAVAMSVSLPALANGPAGGNDSRDALLQAQVAISWSARVSEFGQLIAQRIGVPYLEICPTNPHQLVQVEQGDTASIGDALRTVNQQLQPGQVLELASTVAGLRLELARTTPLNATSATWSNAGAAAASSAAGCDQAGAQELAARQSRAVASVQITSSAAGAQVATQRYVLREGQPVHEQLQGWAQAAGWKLIWYPRVSWQVISSSAFSDDLDVAAAVEAVVTILRAEGKQVLLTVAAANQVMEVTSTDITAESKDGNEE